MNLIPFLCLLATGLFMGLRSGKMTLDLTALPEGLSPLVQR